MKLQVGTSEASLPAGAALAGLAAASSSSLLDSSLLEVSVLVLDFLAVGPFPFSVLLSGAFLFRASGDLGNKVKSELPPKNSSPVILNFTLNQEHKA